MDFCLQHIPGDVYCDCCRMLLKENRTVRQTGPNKFCYVEENNSTAPVKLPASLQREDRLREMGLANRIIHRILTKCYGEDLPSSGLQPEEGELPPPIEKRMRKSAAAGRQAELFQTLLQDAADLDVGNLVQGNEDGDTVILVQTQTQAEPSSSRQRGLEDEDPFDEGQMQPLATSTQQEGPSGVSAKKSAKKPKRLMGF